MSLVNLSDSTQNTGDTTILVPNDRAVLPIAQTEFGFLSPNNKAKLTHLETKGVSYCVGVAGYNSQNGSIGLAHLDDATNIPASIFLMRRVLDRFYLFTCFNDQFLRFTKDEIELQGGIVVKSEATDYFNGTIGSLIIDMHGRVYRSLHIGNRPRIEQMNNTQWVPFSMLRDPQDPLYAAVYVSSKDQQLDWRRLLYKQPEIINPLLHNQKFVEAFDRGQTFFDKDNY